MPRYIIRKEPISVEKAQERKELEISYAQDRVAEAMLELAKAKDAPLILAKEYQEEIPYGHPEWDSATDKFSPRHYTGEVNWVNIPNKSYNCPPVCTKCGRCHRGECE
jgi:hypothetical protein